ncbi:HNH/endonuclease VII fold toxin-2 domain-containing protein [Parachitinimonas caeni]|uniref:HNH/endonuclease VII fold toxin-2 domain-containing protein n=1 Tax=Parachitinimonas caeni TaxID=3031301 RepID=A0ABT7E2G5_9NEIS|nr:HNH/endonuclease VII fold toxin-2 domain-containing protein [Parachitinimonas caeni]MDK2126513.1 HNH/endonuclease VII fold toxin-2 domain-containing protein [Parachitinimonas caeni]
MRSTPSQNISSDTKRLRLAQDLANSDGDLDAPDLQGLQLARAAVPSGDPIVAALSVPRTAASSPPNTPPIFYTSDADIAAACKSVDEAIDNNCKSKTSVNRSGDDKTAFDSIVDLDKQLQESIYGAGRGLSEAKTNSATKWLFDHCEGLWQKPSQNNLGQYSGKRKDPNRTFIKNNRGDVISSYQATDNSMSNMSLEDAYAKMSENWAKQNKCLQAKKCKFIPFKNTDKEKQAKDGKGCCPGQTGHHVMPDAMFRSLDQPAPSSGTKKRKRNDKETFGCWGNYDEGDAPTICVEGTSNHGGSHGLMHDNSTKVLGDVLSQPEMDYRKARDLMSDALYDAFPNCSKECTKAQLDNYYKKAIKSEGECSGKELKDVKVVPHSGASADTSRVRVPKQTTSSGDAP